MINIVISKDKQEYELSMHGHAYYADVGDDIVCAGASAIAYSLLGFLNNCDTVVDVDVIERSGEMELSCSDYSSKVHTAFEMAAIGFLQLEKQYPDCVRVDITNF